MFYTLVGRIPFITSDKSNKKLFKIFLFGSLIYILVHYYLNSGERFALLEKLKSYLYYVMAIDFAVAYFLCKWGSSGEDDDDDDKKNDTYSKDEKDEIIKNIQELRRMQASNGETAKQKMINQQRQMLSERQKNAQVQFQTKQDEKSALSEKSPFMTRDEVAEEKKKEDSSSGGKRKKEEKKKETTESSEPNEKEQTPKKQQKKKQETDTDIPVHMGKK